MFLYTVFDGETACGTARAEPDGLYWQISARCSPPGDALRRLYARSGEDVLCLGVLMPAGESCVLDKRISARTFCFTEGTEISFDGDVWLPFSGEIFGMRIKGAKKNGERIAFPYEAEMPIPVLPLFCFLKPTRIDGKPCLVLNLGEIKEQQL